LRNNAAVRAKEELSQFVRVVHGSEPAHVEYREGELSYQVDLLGEQKTGAFLDQLDNHLAIRKYAYGCALDAYCYHGGFAFQLAHAGCDSVIACDQSASALEVVEARARVLGLEQVRAHRGDVTEFLESYRGEPFDVISIDPPAFASTRSTLKRAMRAYSDLNALAWRALRRGGVLVSSSCSGHVTATALEEAILEAARREGVRAQILERRGAGIDHPILMGVPETEYLKCLVLRRV